jgi:hypothetical protein
VQIPVGYLQVNWKWTGPDLPFGAETTLASKIIDGQLPDEAAAALDGLMGSSDIMPLLDNDLHLSGTLVKYGPNATGPSAEVSSGYIGDGGSQGMTPNQAWLIQKNTVDGGHAGRGRMFMPGMPVSDFDNHGAIFSASLTTFQSAASSFLDDLQGAGYVPVVLHGPGSPLSTPSVITSFTVDARIATQRRRLRR